jgi:heme/copper-type cytochrome/quinol oxidase subunit 3
VFAIFAGVYYWFPSVTGRALNHRLGVVHFWASLVTMTAIFVPMFTLGLRGVNRRLYDAGMQYANAQGTLGIQEHMTWAAIALGVAQVPFLVNLVLSLRARRQLAVAPALGPAHGAIPWTYEPRTDTRTTNVRAGVWLFLASEAMLFGSLFSAYVLLRTGAASWPDASRWVHAPLVAGVTLLLLLTLTCLQMAVRGGRGSAGDVSRTRQWVWTAAGMGVLFLVVKLFDYNGVLAAGMRPADNLALACWFVLTGVHWLHVAGGVGANAWVARTATRLPPRHLAERLHALRLYWAFVDLIWIAILVCFFI